MIPKTIHYCWFGRNKKPNKVLKCIQSWRRQCPNFEIIEWNEDNFDCHSNAYYEWCYQNKKWAFLSDLARLEIIEKFGGIYLDTDVELVRSLDSLLKYPAFLCFETQEYIATGLGFGACKNHPIIRKMIDEYAESKEIIHGGLNYIPANCPILNTKALVKCGLKQNGEMQTVENAIILPTDFFNPYDDPTGKLLLTDNTYGIHWYFKSALPKTKIVRSFVTRPFHRLFGKNCFEKIKYIIK